jgi:hypothetical protein
MGLINSDLYMAPINSELDDSTHVNKFRNRLVFYLFDTLELELLFFPFLDVASKLFVVPLELVLDCLSLLFLVISMFWLR